MKCCSLLCLTFGFLIPLGGASQAMGIEAAARAEEFIASCNSKSILARPGCLHANLNRKWKYDLDYAGQAFSAIGKFEEVKKSLAGNLFAFMMVGQYRVACQVTQKHADALATIGGRKDVLINGVLESYHLTFNLHSLHHLRLTAYCSIEPAA